MVLGQSKCGLGLEHCGLEHQRILVLGHQGILVLVRPQQTLLLRWESVVSRHCGMELGPLSILVLVQEHLMILVLDLVQKNILVHPKETPLLRRDSVASICCAAEQGH